MDFNIRAMSMARSIAMETRVSIDDLLGKKVEFRAGITIPITLPNSADQFRLIAEPERVLAGLAEWTRVYRVPAIGGYALHIIAAADGPDDESLFYRIDLGQPPQSLRGPRAPVNIAGGGVMDYGECVRWLAELSYRHGMDGDKAQRWLGLPQLPALNLKKYRIAWVGPEVLGAIPMQSRLTAIGSVFGVDVIQISPRTYAHVQKVLSAALPLDAVIICEHFAPYIGNGVVPSAIRADLVHRCGSSDQGALEEQVYSWIEIVIEAIASEVKDTAAAEQQMLLNIMVRGMLSHSKIGQFMHCQKATVMTGIRARRLNVPLAEHILDKNSEVFQDTKSSETLFLWKDHHDGRQYFLNPDKVNHAKTLIVSGTPS